MRHPEGMRVTLVDESRMDAAGVLHGAQGCTQSYGLPDEAVQLFLLVAACGEGGLARSKIPKHLQKELAVHLIPLEMQELVQWERDNRGRPAYLVLTWKGEEALAAAKPLPPSGAQHAKARRRAVNGGGA